MWINSRLVGGAILFYVVVNGVRSSTSDVYGNLRVSSSGGRETAVD